MKTRTALAAALASGAAAVLLVGVDLALNVDATFEVLSGGTWQEVAGTRNSGAPYLRGPACGQDYRLTVHNGLLWSTTVAVTITRNGNPAHQTWSLAPGETRSSETLHINATAAPNGVPAKGTTSLEVQVGNDFYASAYGCPEAVA